MELLAGAKQGESIPTPKEGIKDLRDQTPRWLWNAYKAVNDKKLVQKVSLPSGL